MVRFLVCLALPAAALACSCMGNGPPCDAAWKASAVFKGTVIDVTHDATRTPSESPSLSVRVLFEVAEPFIGMQGRGKQVEVRTGMGGGDCGYPFRRAESYVVYASVDKDGILAAYICSRTAPVDRAQADLAYLRSLPTAGPTGYIYGVVGDGEREGHIDQSLGMWVPFGLAGAAVTLTGSGRRERLVTGDDGLFRFNRLPPGEYTVSSEKEGYSTRGNSSALKVHAGGCAYSWQSLVVNRRIVGKVTGADGLPAASIQVELVPRRPTQPNQLPSPITDTRTGADGTYELRNVPAGEYYLGINLVRTPSKDMPYTRYFYPGTEDPTQATVIVVGQGPGTGAYHFAIPAAQKERGIQGVVYWPDGRPADKVWIMLEDIRWPWQTSTVNASTDSSGRFQVSAFDGTAYRIHAITMARYTNESFSAEPFPIGPGTDLTQPLRLLLTRKGHSAADLTGKGLDRWRAGLGL